MQPSRNTNTLKLQDGNSSGNLTGIVYVPNAQLFLNDSGGDHSGGTVAYDTDLIVCHFTTRRPPLRFIVTPRRLEALLRSRQLHWWSKRRLG